MLQTILASRSFCTPLLCGQPPGNCYTETSGNTRLGALTHYRTTDVEGNNARQRTFLILPPGRGSSLGTIVMDPGAHKRVLLKAGL